MDKYMIVILYIIGTLGAILNIITFLQKQIRRNSCSLYFLSSSIIDFCIMNVFILMEIITTFNKPLSDRIYSTNIWCKVGNYIMFILPCLSSSYITLASIDRFCISSLNQTLRKCSNFKISRIVISMVFVVWVLFGLHILIGYDRIRDITTNTDRCTVQTSSATVFIVIDGFFFALFNGAIIPFILCIFGLLIFHNIKVSRQRVNFHQYRGNNNTVNPTRIGVNRQNFHMILMLLVQVFLTIIFNTPYIVVYLSTFYKRLSFDSYNLFLYIIFSFIARWFYYMNYCKTFYINTLTSELFRNSLRKQFILFGRHHRLNITRTIIPTIANNR
ncbi:unnamed protein product [Rotaria sordida]|uniref:G-protein coupled receptors family 1 profile domain-containing protein n=1 Tax=Rotaria sordida TaxID=392033 RepID=A0A814A2W7_9BILA|nr:unnamed protein product [Rotaria sordida]CAF1322315.1 unnamed protein product [Rotaria sordida]CAF1559955.1 unnamed protein product [Rotaria sordida]